MKVPKVPLVGFTLLFRGCPSTEPLPVSSASLEVSTPFSVFPHGAAANVAGLAGPDRLRLQVFSTS